MLTKQQILDEIKRTAKENGGKPLGVARIEKEAGIKPYDWGRYWARFGDAQIEAGFSANQLISGYDDTFLIEKMISLIRKLDKFPTHREIRIEKNNDPELPDSKVFERWPKQEFANKVIEFCQSKRGYEDVIELCNPIVEKSNKPENFASDSNEKLGEVYLFKSGRFYKIGKTYDTVRRGTELRIQLPEKMDLIHSIKTDDPSGIEAYWHRRFESKRMNGEWFDLNSADIKAFKRWKRIV
jgi:Meiotically up-regulated gene 113